MAVYGLHGLLGSNMAPARPDPLEWLRQPPVGVTSEANGWPLGAPGRLGQGPHSARCLITASLSTSMEPCSCCYPARGSSLPLMPMFSHRNPDVGEVAGVLATVTLDLENDLITAGFDLTVSIDGLLEFGFRLRRSST